MFFISQFLSSFSVFAHLSFLPIYFTYVLMRLSPSSICVLSFFCLFFLVMCKDNKKARAGKNVCAGIICWDLKNLD